MISNARVTTSICKHDSPNSWEAKPSTNSVASRMLSRMSYKASLTDSERINGFALGRRLHMRLERNTVGHVDADREQIFDAVNDPDVLENIHPNVRRDFDQNVDVAVEPGITAGAGAEQGGMAHALSFQGGFMLAQS